MYACNNKLIYIDLKKKKQQHSDSFVSCRFRKVSFQFRFVLFLLCRFRFVSILYRILHTSCCHCKLLISTEVNNCNTSTVLFSNYMYELQVFRNTMTENFMYPIRYFIDKSDKQTISAI